MPDPLNTTASAVGLISKVLDVISWFGRRFKRKPSDPLFPSVEYTRHYDFELQPIKITVDLITSIPYIEIDCYGINYLNRDLKVISAEITQLHFGPGIDRIPVSQEYTLHSKSTQYISFRRKLWDSEVRVITQILTHQRVNASFTVTVKAKAINRNREYLFQRHGVPVEGWANK